jgi:hypothetical protein
MKKSNIILISLLVALYIIPAMVWGFNKMNASGDYITGFSNHIRVVQIENNALKKENIVVNTKRASNFSQNGMHQSINMPYLYYSGNRKYRPEVRMEDDILIVGKATNAPADAKLQLHIRINDISVITLNGETVWRR